MRSVVVTGAGGMVGTVVAKHLQACGLEVRSIDLRDGADLVAPSAAAAAVAGMDGLVHCAWNTTTENYANRALDPANTLMLFNVLAAAQDAGLTRAVVASSVHAQAYGPADSEVAPKAHPIPDSPYGASKLQGEALCRWASATGSLETVSIRLGAVTPNDQPHESDQMERRVWLSHRDCADLFHRALTSSLATASPIIYGVSNNEQRIHSIHNALGWQPLDRARAAMGTV